MSNKMTGHSKLRFRHLDDLREHLRRLKRANSITTTKRWTFGQILYHLAAAFEGSVRGLPPGYPRPIRWMAHRCRKLITRGWFPAGLPVPASIRSAIGPPVDVCPVDQWQRLMEAIDRFELAGDDLPPHPVLGRMDKQEWTCFHLRHCELHLGFAIPQDEAVHGQTP